LNDRLSRLESRVEEIARTVADLDQRLTHVEERRAVPLPAPAVAPAGAAAPLPIEADLPASLALFGRTVLALGGAYLLRAFTEAGALSPSTGILLGFGYALSFVLLAHRAAAAKESTSAAFHCGAAALIGYPLLWETTVRVRFLEPRASALAVFAFTLALFWVVWRWRLTSAAWVVHVAAIATAFALVGGTRAVLPFTAGLVGFALMSLWLGYERGLPALALVSAVAADLAVLLLAFGAWIQRGVASTEGAASVLMLFFLGYVGSFFHRSMVEGRPASVFEMIQASVATLVGFGGAMTLADRPGAIALASLSGIGAASACCLGGLGRFRRLASPSPRNALFFVLLALPMALFATSPIPGRTYLWSAAAVGAYLLGSRLHRIEVSLHGGAYLLAAAVAGGLLARFAYAFVAPASRAWPAFSPASSVPLAAAIACCAVAVPEESSWKAWEFLPKVLRLGIALLGAAAVSLFVLAAPIAGQPGFQIDSGALAALRTALLSGAAIGLGALGGIKKWREAIVLLYPLLVLTGIKLVLEDFRLGRAETLFAALACYGAALILAPRLARGRRSIPHE
jgi:hypothetical protein